MSANDIDPLPSWGWAVYNYGTSIHVVPINDDHEHDHHEDCWCGPEEDEEGLIVHNSNDGREDYETGLRKPH